MTGHQSAASTHTVSGTHLRRVLCVMFATLALTLSLGIGSAGARAQEGPVLSVRNNGETLSWTAVGRRHLYKLLSNGPEGRRVIEVGRRSYRPPAIPGETVAYRVRPATGEGAWSNTVKITYPAVEEEAEESAPEAPKERPSKPPKPPVEEPVEQPESEPPTGPEWPVESELPTTPEEEVPGTRPGGMVVGLNAGGWGPTAFSDIAGAVNAVRMESRFATDSEVGAAANAGVSVASWVLGTKGSIGAIEPTKYAAEVVSLFKRYGKGGTFWAGRPDLGGTAVEVLNEPGNPYFWSDPTNYSAYVKLLKTVHEALAANFPEAIRPRVLASWDGGEGPTSPFGPAWAALGGLKYCDGVTVHPYGGSTGQDGGALGGHTDVAAAHAASEKPVYVTEIGWPTAIGQPSTGDSQQWTEAQQAQNITNFIVWARQTEYVPMVLYFNYVDYGTNNFYGIETKTRAHKLGFRALAEA
ncbi:MAG TPA: hypothetical protein VK774_10020 [Solirubrobacteraceae bacterium]|nr:hypothetical protein [Solirubrobacteraceae bacterium]